MRTFAATLLVVVSLLSAAAASAQEQPEPMPEYPPVAPEIYNRGLDSLNSDDFDQAVLDFSTFILLNPLDGRAYYLRAVGYSALGHNEIALDDLTHAIEFTDNLPEIRAAGFEMRGRIHAQDGRPDAALADFSDAVEIAPSAELYQMRASLYLDTNNWEAALSDLDDAIGLGADDPVLYFYRATAQVALDETEDAASDYFEWVNGIQEQRREEDEMEAGQSRTLQLEPSLVYSIPFVAEPGQVVNIIAANVSGDADPLMVLVGPDGEPLAGNDDINLSRDKRAAITDFVVPEEGEYSLLITHSITGYNGRIIVLFELDEA